MIQKYFPLDKNYLLKKAQWEAKEALLIEMIRLGKGLFCQLHNPLGLEDDFIKALKNHQEIYDPRFDAFYDDLAGFYRLKYGTNQLEILFDGRSHEEKYRQEWSALFLEWIEHFCYQERFLIALLEASVFLNASRKITPPEKRMHQMALQYFDIRFKRKRKEKVLISAKA